MLVARRNSMEVGKRLPYDAEVEYIEGVGSKSWINTGITTGFAFASWSYGPVTPISGFNGVWGARFGSSFFGLYHDPNETGATLRFIANGANGNNIYIGKNVTDVSNRRVVYGSASFELLTPLTLFRSYGVGNNLNLRFSSFSLGTTYGVKDVIDLVAVRFTNEQGVSEGAMYDKVTKRLLRNRGTVAFVIGPDKSAANGGGGYKRKCVRRSYRRSLRLSSRFWRTPLWKEVA